VHEYRLGVDLGGTKIEAAVLDADGRMVDRQRVPTPGGQYDATLEAIAGLVEMLEKRTGRASIGLATPGARSLVDGRMKNCNSTCLNGRPLKEDLERRLGREIRMENDANCFALSEAVDGAARDAHVVFGVILGTGVGGGIVVDRRVLSGANAIAGEWGHNPLPLPDAADLPLRPCYCGRSGCIETYLCGGALARGDSLEEYLPRLARSLAGVIYILDPDVIVLGGGVSNIGRLYQDLPPRCKEFVFSDDIRTRIVPPVYGDSSGVRGAAWLWNE
jgi:predicted NBD/HSP70 family sugar kinase